MLWASYPQTVSDHFVYERHKGETYKASDQVDDEKQPEEELIQHKSHVLPVVCLQTPSILFTTRLFASTVSRPVYVQIIKRRERFVTIVAIMPVVVCHRSRLVLLLRWRTHVAHLLGSLMNVENAFPVWDGAVQLLRWARGRWLEGAVSLATAAHWQRWRFRLWLVKHSVVVGAAAARGTSLARHQPVVHEGDEGGEPARRFLVTWLVMDVKNDYGGQQC